MHLYMTQASVSTAAEATLLGFYFAVAVLVFGVAVPAGTPH